MLDKLKFPDDLKNLRLNELRILCGEIRDKIVDVVSKNGGHLASNLGVIELTVALHKVFDFKKDDIVWDVGHQSYTHKILTGRLDELYTIRKKGGISGFPKIAESIFDSFGTGHSSTSISAALGISEAKNLSGRSDSKTVAVIGDGALTGGLAYEGLNNAGSLGRNFIVILNDNKMSISRNVGAIARYLSAVRLKASYLRAKGAVAWSLGKLPVIGDAIRRTLLYSKSALKKFLYGTIFENMGFLYYFVSDGHNLEELIKALSVIKNIKKPVLLHVRTVKGKGYIFAEKKPQEYHGTSNFDVNTGTGNRKAERKTFSSVFGEKICKIAKNDNRVCAITAAMKDGTGLNAFSKCFKDRFFDVGIAEEHAVTFAAGLAAKGMIPVFAVYSSFLQRSYDQILHDAALQNLRIILAIDRAGIVGQDGETHQGIFDVPFLNTIPNVEIYSPSFLFELETILEKLVKRGKGLIAIRYPKGSELYKPDDFGHKVDIDGDYYLLPSDDPCDTLIITYGRLFSNALLARKQLIESGKKVSVLKLNKIKPVSEEALKIAAGFRNVFFFEEGILNGGVGQIFKSEFLNYSDSNTKFVLKAIANKFVPHDTVDSSLASLGFDVNGMLKTISGGSAKYSISKIRYVC